MSHRDASTAAYSTTLVDCDFLIVGAGSSGCVLASRLVRRGLKVMLIERGTTDAGKLGKLVGKPSSWNQDVLNPRKAEQFITVPQSELSYRRIPAYRGYGGGGSSNVNAGLYFRGCEGDYKVWPWAIADVEASFASIEAELTLEVRESKSAAMPTWEKILEEAGVERIRSPTTASEEPTWDMAGVGGPAMRRTTTRGGERQSAWAAFVNPVAAMPNFRVKGGAFASRIIIEDGRAVGVELCEETPTWFGMRKQARRLRLAKDTAEIILCCGAFRTPKLLMLSGIGPKAHLQEKGVQTLLDMPHVGGNLQDHLNVGIFSWSKTRISGWDDSEDGVHNIVLFPCPGAADHATSDSAQAKTVAANPNMMSIMIGEGDHLALNAHRFVRFMLTSPGVLMAVARAVVVALTWFATRLTPLGRLPRRMYTAAMILSKVESRGTVRLASRDAADPPLIDPAFLSDPEDRRALCASWRLLRRAKTETPTGKACFAEAVVPGRTWNYGRDDESFLSYARNYGLSMFHPVGTCRMGRGPEDSVVSAENLRVHGVKGLRVADASIAPRIPSSPTHAMAMMIGDRAAALILNDRYAREQVQARMLEAASRSVN